MIHWSLAAIMIMTSGLCICPMPVMDAVAQACVVAIEAPKVARGMHSCCVAGDEHTNFETATASVPADHSTPDSPTCCVIAARSFVSIKPDNKSRVDPPVLTHDIVAKPLMLSPIDPIAFTPPVPVLPKSSQTLLEQHCALNC